MPETNNKQTLPISWLSETPLNQEIKFDLTENPTKEALKEYIERIKDTRKQETDALAKEILGDWNTTENLIAQLKQDIQTSSVEAPKPDEAPAPAEAPPPAWWEEWWWDEKNKEPLPLAPTTTFNILRLVQRGYIPINPVKPEGKGFFWKTLQWAKYIYYWADLAFLKIQQWWAKSQEHGISKIYEKLWADLKASPYFNQVVKTEIDTISKELIAYEAVNKPDLKKIERLKWEVETLKKIRWVLDKPWNNVLELSNLADEYIKSRWNYNPAGTWRKTPADITTENANATKKVDDARKTIKDLEKDLKAEKNGWKDSRGRLIKTEVEIKKMYDEGLSKINTLRDEKIKKLTIDWDEKIKNKNDELIKKTKEVTDLDGELGRLKKEWDDISAKEKDINRQLAGSNEIISMENQIKIKEGIIASERLKKTKDQSTSILSWASTEIEVLNDKISKRKEIEHELMELKTRKKFLWDIDIRSKIIVPIPPETSLLHSIEKDLLDEKFKQKGLKDDIEDFEKRKKNEIENTQKIHKKRIDDHQKKLQEVLEEKTKRIALLEKRKKNWEDITLPKRTSDEAKIRTINNEISAVQGKIAVIEQIDTDLGIAARANNIPEVERLEKLRNSKINQRQELLKKLWELRAQKNTEAQTFFDTGSKDKTTVDEEIGARQAELDKLNGLAHEFDELNNKIEQLRQEAVDLTNKLNSPSTDTKEAFEFHEKASKRIWEIASEINQINAIWQEKFNGSGINWPNISPLELAWLRKKNGFFAFMEKHAQAPTLDSPSKWWKFAKWWGYGAMKLVALTWVVRQGIHSGVALSKGQVLAWTYDAADLALWFIPWIWWGSYDMLTWAQQLITKTDMIGRKVESWAAWTRLWFWALAFVTLWGSKYLELAVKWGKLAKLWINWTRAISTVEGIENITNIAKVTQKVGTGVYGTYALVDMWGQLIKNPTAYITWVEAPKSKPQAPKATWTY